MRSHGRSGYSYGCRCDVCREAKKAANAARYRGPFTEKADLEEEARRAARETTTGWRMGLPSTYVYGGTGESMSHREAEWWLCGTVSEAKVCPICDD